MSRRLPPLTAPERVDLEALQERIDLVALVERELGVELRRSGGEWRGECPKHASDSRKTLNVNPEKGRWTCRSCKAGGDAIRFLEWHREISFRESLAIVEDLAGVRAAAPSRPAPADPLATRRPALKAAAAARPELEEHVARYEAGLAGSPGERYLAERRIPLAVAQRLRVGYAAPGQWAHVDEEGRLVRQWRHGRIAAPHTNAAGELVNVYGRAVGEVPAAEKDKKHDHFRGKKGIFNGRALVDGEGPVFVCEGVFDALALAAAGVERVVACFGLDQWPWPWAKEARALVLVLDQDAHGAGQKAALEFARAARLRGKRVAIVPAAAYGGAKDVAEAWQRGTLDVAAVLASAAALDERETAAAASQEMAAGATETAADAPAEAAAESGASTSPQASTTRRSGDGLEELVDVFLADESVFAEHGAIAEAAAAERRREESAERKERRRVAFVRAVHLVCDALAGGSRSVDELKRRAREAGLDGDALQAAREALGVRQAPVRGMTGGGGLVQLPPGPCRCNGGEMPERIVQGMPQECR